MAVFIGGVLAWEKPTYNGLHYPGTAFFLHAVKNDPNAGFFRVVNIKMRKMRHIGKVISKFSQKKMWLYSV